MSTPFKQSPRMCRWQCSLLVLALLLAVTPVRAHHSAAMFDDQQSLTLSGTVKQFQWSNPHCWIQLLVSEGDSGRGGALLAEARSLAEAIGMPALLARITALGAAGAPALPDGLSAREVDVLRLIAAGCSNREIGASLFISEHTAANHIRSILRKTGAANRTEAAAYAHANGLIAG